MDTHEEVAHLAEALHAHEIGCAKRDGDNKARFTGLEGSVKSLEKRIDGMVKILYWFGTAIFGGVVLINVKEWFLT